MKTIIRKMFALLLIVCMAASLAACGGDDDGGKRVNDTTVMPTGEETPALTASAEATPSPTPGSGTTPTATPTATVTPADPSQDTPDADLTPRVTGAPQVRTGVEYKITTNSYGDEKDRTRQAEIAVAANKKEGFSFSAQEYAAKHRAEWDAVAVERIAKLTSRLGDTHKRGFTRMSAEDRPYDIFMDEYILETHSLGAQGEIGVYAHAALYCEEREESTWMCGSYIVSCRLINNDMSQQYAILYEKTIYPDDYSSGRFFVDFYYANSDGSVDRYDPESTKRMMASVAFGFTGVEYDGNDCKFYCADTYSDTDAAVRELFTVRIDRANGSGKLMSGELLDPRGDCRYRKEGGDWKVLSYRLCDVVNTLYRHNNKETVVFPELEKMIADGVFKATEPLDEERTLRAEVKLDGDNAHMRLWYICEGYEVLLDDGISKVYSVYELESGERLLYGKGSERRMDVWNVTDNANAVPEMTLRYFPKDAIRVTVVFEGSAFAADNKEKFEKNAAAYEKELRAAYKGKTIVKQNKLAEYPLESFGFLAVYEIAAFGGTPKQIGDVNTIYRYEVCAVWMDAKAGVTECVLYETEKADQPAPKGAVDFVVISHSSFSAIDLSEVCKDIAKDNAPELGLDPDARTTSDDVVTIVTVGRDFPATTEYHGSYFQYGYNEEYHLNTCWFDASDRRLMDSYDSWGESTCDYWSAGSELRDANDRVRFSEYNYETTVMSYSMKQIIAAYLEKGADLELEVDETAPKELLKRVSVKKTEGDYEYYTGTYYELAQLDKDSTLFCVTSQSGPKWYSIKYYIIRGGKVLQLVDADNLVVYALGEEE